MDMNARHIAIMWEKEMQQQIMCEYPPAITLPEITLTQVAHARIVYSEKLARFPGAQFNVVFFEQATASGVREFIAHLFINDPDWKPVLSTLAKTTVPAALDAMMVMIFKKLAARISKILFEQSESNLCTTLTSLFYNQRTCRTRAKLRARSP